jgi:DNA-binding transcriptional LysR family regulator
MRVLADRGHRLYASPQLIEQMGALHSPAGLTRWPGLSLASGKHVHRWELFGPQGAQAEVHFTPRMITTDMLALREAAVAGVGVVQLPQLMVKDQLAAGELVALLDGWEPKREFTQSFHHAGIIAVSARISGFLNGRICADD